MSHFKNQLINASFMAAAILGASNASHAATIEQRATATGYCGVAINAIGQAKVVVNNFCDPKLAASLQNLMDSLASLERKHKVLTNRLSFLEIDASTTKRRTEELVQIFQSFLNQGKNTSSLAVEKRAQELLEYPNLLQAIATLGKKAAANSKQAAGLYRQQAVLLKLVNSNDALAAFEKSLSIDPHSFETLEDAGTLAEEVGLSARALQYFERMLQLANSKITNDKDGVGWLYKKAISHNKIGTFLEERLQLPMALEHHEAALSVTKRLITMDPLNSEWQAELATSYIKLATALQTQGNFEAALIHYEKSKNTLDTLATLDPSQAIWQRGKGLTHANIGYIYRTLGNYAEAQHNQQAALHIWLNLAAQYPSTSKWGLYAAANQNLIASALSQTGQTNEALKILRTTISTTTTLIDSEPSNNIAKIVLRDAYVQIGGIYNQESQTRSALENYRAALAISRNLVEKEPTQMKWRASLAYDYSNIAETLEKEDVFAAQQNYESSLLITKALSESDQGNNNWLDDLGNTYYKLGLLAFGQRKTTSALAFTSAAKSIQYKLISIDSKNRIWMENYSNTKTIEGDILNSTGDLDAAAQSYIEAFNISNTINSDAFAKEAWQQNYVILSYKAGIIKSKLLSKEDRLNLLSAGKIMLSSLIQRNLLPTERQITWPKIFDEAIAKLR